MDDSCIFTIISKNYLPCARVLFKSFSKYHPEIKPYVLLADKIDGYFIPQEEPFEVIEADTIGIADFESFSFKYNIVEFNTAVKPFFFDYLFSRYNFKKILYFDPDIYFFNPVGEILNALDKFSIVLSPHISFNILPDDGRIPRNIDILKAGCFNLGFIGLSKSLTTENLLLWWKQMLYDKCLQSPFSGYAVDQIWISLVPSFYDDYLIVREPGYNVAYWNLHERSITKKDDKFFINNTPLYFFHFSGFNPEDIEDISKYQNRFKLHDVPGLFEIFGLYKALLIENGYSNTVHWPYHYGFYKNGSRISELSRGIYWGIESDSAKFGNPFVSFYRKLLKPQNIRRMFTERFFRIMFDKFLLYAWKSYLTRK